MQKVRENGTHSKKDVSQWIDGKKKWFEMIKHKIFEKSNSVIKER